MLDSLTTTGKAVVVALVVLVGVTLGLTAESWNPYTRSIGHVPGQVVDDTATPDIPPCDSDDGSGPRPCRWDAATQGNGTGESFTIDADGQVTP